MTDYTDIEQVTALQQEQARVQQALEVLNDHGTISSVVAAPTEESASPMGMPISVMTPDASQSMVAGVRSGLIQRYNEINKELRDLGVTGTPPDLSQGGGPGPHEAAQQSASR